MTVYPAKTQMSLSICPVWSEFSLWDQWVAKDPSFLHADSEDWSDWADAQADLSLRWAHIYIVGFDMRQLKCYTKLQDHHAFKTDTCTYPDTCLLKNDTEYKPAK